MVAKGTKRRLSLVFPPTPPIIMRPPACRLVSCSADVVGAGAVDAGVADTGAVDACAVDAGAVDAGVDYPPKPLSLNAGSGILTAISAETWSQLNIAYGRNRLHT